MGEKLYRGGYKNPPKEHQFKKGQSGNPKGRPKGSRNLPSLYKDLLEEKINITEGGKSKTMTTQEAITRRVRADALKGKEKAIDRILEHAPQSADEEARYTASEWLEEFLLPKFKNIEDLDVLIRVLEEDEKPKRKKRKIRVKKIPKIE